jgi:hypothetical protein
VLDVVELAALTSSSAVVAIVSNVASGYALPRREAHATNTPG